MFGTGNTTGPGSQAGSSNQSDPVEIVYHFIRLLRPETVETQKINTQADGTTYLRPRKTKHIDEEINAIAEVLAETQFNTLSSNCVLTPHGYANRGLFKPALIKIEAQNFKKALTNMLQDGAFIYKASTISEQVVGVAVITRIAKDFPIRTHPPRAHWHVPPPIPDVTDVMAVDTYARSQYMETELGNQWRIIFNGYREQNNPDRLWELSSVGVKEAYRRQDIGRTLCRYALSLVPIGDWVLVQSEPTTEVMFQHLGFYYAVTKDNQFKAVNVAPEWEEQGALKQFRLMTFQKPHQRLDAQALRGFQPPNQSFMVL
ncbi:hypothetical protein F4825DRAFT_470390 [Nemania diffusa]|nr:hypothetical protein F4825DRAFT_470390 [Nemania diffusa]